MKVAIIMGSKSDWPVVQKAANMLTDFGVEIEKRIISAHRTPKQAEEFAANAEANGVDVIIAAAGKAAHLAGVSGGNNSAAGNRNSNEIKHNGWAGFPAVCSTDAKRCACCNSSYRRS